jgi:hypothetical protein
MKDALRQLEEQLGRQKQALRNRNRALRERDKGLRPSPRRRPRARRTNGSTAPTAARRGSRVPPTLQAKAHGVSCQRPVSSFLRGDLTRWLITSPAAPPDALAG